MSKLKLLTFAIIGLLTINLGMVAFFMLSKPPKYPERLPSMQREGPRNLIISRLHLDTEQIVQYEKLISEHQSLIRSMDDSIRMAKNNLYQALNESDTANKNTLLDRLGYFQKQIETIHYNHFAAIKKLCRHDQMTDYEALTHDLARFFAPGKKIDTPPKDLP